MLLGNYNGIPTHTVSILEGMRNEFNGARHSLRCRHAVPEPRRRAGAESAR